MPDPKCIELGRFGGIARRRTSTAAMLRGACVALLLFSCAGERKAPPEAPRAAADALGSGAVHDAALAATTAAPTTNDAAVALGRHGAVSSAEAHASEIGLAVLRRGGNAVDAAVAVGFALGVTHPSAGNIGGGGFLLLRTPDGSATAIDYREVAPGAATAGMFVDAQGHASKDSAIGPRAAGIPGVVAGFAFVHAKYGKLPWAELVAPAVELAEHGWQLDELHARELAEANADIVEYEGTLPAQSRALHAALAATLKTFGHDEKRAVGQRDLSAGALWRQPELAATLRAIMNQGPRAFYEGRLAQQMASEMQAMGGLWTEADLAGYHIVERKPIAFSYRGYDILSMPPPSAGGIALRQIFAASEQLGMYELDWDSVPRMHLFAEVLRRVFADRNERIADPDFVQIPIERLLDPAYVARRMADIDPRHATPSSHVAPGGAHPESRQTTHFSVVDEAGFAVANTFTLNGDFGAKVQIPGTGVTLNDEMDDFTALVGVPNQFGLVQGAQNAIAPGKRMLSSMSPTIVVRDGKLRAVLGSPGGPTIISTVAQIALQLIDTGRSLDRAVAAPRIHHQWWPDQISYEPALPAAKVQGLAALGHHMENEGLIGHANCIEVDPQSGLMRAVADVQRYGGKALAF